MRRRYTRPHKYTADELEYERLRDLLVDARSSYRDTRPGGYWAGNADMVAYARKCHEDYKAGKARLRATAND